MTNNGTKNEVKKRNGHWTNVDAPLDSGKVIWAKLEAVVSSYEKYLADYS